MHRTLPAAALVAAFAVAALAGCTSSNPHASTSTASASSHVSTPDTDAGLPSGVTAPPTVPTSVANVVALRKDIVMTSCKATASGWGATGTAANPAATAHTYTVTIFFTTQHATVIGYGSTHVTVAPGGKESWTIADKFHAAPTTLCVLRGVG